MEDAAGQDLEVAGNGQSGCLSTMATTQDFGRAFRPIQLDFRNTQLGY